MERRTYRILMAVVLVLVLVPVLYQFSMSYETKKESFDKEVKSSVTGASKPNVASICPPPPTCPRPLTCPPPPTCPRIPTCPPPPPTATDPTSTTAFDFRGAVQDDPKLIDFIRKEVLLPPSPLKYNLSSPNKLHFSQFDQSKHADVNFFHGMRDGFFVEAGAVDGEYLSNSLYFERELGWRGLLIEPVPATYDTLTTRNRKAYSANVAIAIEPKASETKFQPIGGLGVNSIFGKGGVNMKTIPLFSLLLALNVTVVDFMSLDIESFEVKVLKTIPWDRIKFRLMMIETPHIPEGAPHLIEYLASKGYKYYGSTIIDAWFGMPSLLDEINFKPTASG